MPSGFLGWLFKRAIELEGLEGLGTNRDIWFRTRSKTETIEILEIFESFKIFEVFEMLILSNANAMQS